MKLKSNRGNSSNLISKPDEEQKQVELKRANHLGGEQFGGEDLSFLMKSEKVSPAQKEKTSKIKINKKKFDRYK